MNYDEFRHQLLEELNNSIKTNGQINNFELSSTMKNNENTMDSIVVNFVDDRQIKPCFYPEEIFEDYSNGQTMDSIIDHIIEQSEYCYSHTPKFEANSLASESVKNNLYLQLINGESNPLIKDNCAHFQVNDLIAVARCKIEIDGQSGSYLVNHKIQSEMHLTDDELLSIARENTLQKPYTIKSLAEVIGESLGIAIDDSVSPILVLTNPEGINGSVHMINSKATTEASKILGGGEDTNFFIIPSSIHELLLIPETMVDDPANLSLMCSEVNTTVVKNTEILSNSVYRYDYETQKISICNNLQDLHKLQETTNQKQTHHRRQAI